MPTIQFSQKIYWNGILSVKIYMIKTQNPLIFHITLVLPLSHSYFPFDCCFGRSQFIFSVRVCVCVCVSVHVFVLLPWWLLLSARCLKHTSGARIKDLGLWIVIWVLLPSSFISVSENVIFHLQRWKLQPARTGEKTI